MPWTWLHATKDYLEMAQHLERHPKMRATINLVPSLLKQIDEYINQKAYDPVLDLMTKPANSLSANEKDFMLDNFFLAHRETLIFRSQRYHELFDKANDGDKGADYTEQDYRDLAVHYSLAWTGEIARMSEPYRSLVEKDRNYTEDDKQALARAQMENVRKIIPLHEELAKRGQVELTTTPFYHPILPLLVDSRSAYEAMPNAVLPQVSFNSPEEAERQIVDGRRYFESHIGLRPRGMWPSEGSLSQDVLALIAKNGYEWTATDEGVLRNSIRGGDFFVNGSKIKPEHAAYFPWRAQTARGELTLFFRDHRLSDDIGFTYQSWQAIHAVEQVVSNILRIRHTLTEEYGEHILDHACVSIILDGENCWEYYQRNGFEFLNALYTSLASHADIQTVTFSDVVTETKREALPILPRLVAGSWINSNFRIWIGHPEDNAAWDAIAEAKDALDRARERAKTIPKSANENLIKQIAIAEEELMIAEGSDWWWWYGDDHYSPQKYIFDELFRMHLRAVYVNLDISVPHYLAQPISLLQPSEMPHAVYGAMHPVSEELLLPERTV